MSYIINVHANDTNWRNVFPGQPIPADAYRNKSNRAQFRIIFQSKKMLDQHVVEKYLRQIDINLKMEGCSVHAHFENSGVILMSKTHP